MTAQLLLDRPAGVSGAEWAETVDALTRREFLTGGTALGALGLGLAACGSRATAGRASPAGMAFPAHVDTAFGTVTIPSDPKRVVALGWGDAETALALGVQPVGASDWVGFGGSGVGPWAARRYRRKPVILGTLELNYEQVAALDPDLILNTKSSGQRSIYDRLRQIAPTVDIPTGGADWATSSTQQIDMVSAALGKVREGRQLIASIEGIFARARAEHRDFAGQTVTVASYTSQGWGAYIANTDYVRFMERLGFHQSPTVEKRTPDGFSVTISSEQLDLLDADLLVVLPIGTTTREIERVPLFERIPAVKDGRYVILGERLVEDAFAVYSPLSIAYAVAQTAPRFARALRATT